MTTVDAAQRLVIGTLDAIFHQDKGALVELCQIIQEFIAYAVRARAYHDAHHIFHLQCLLIHRSEMLHLVVGIGIRLEISQIFHIRIFPAEESLALLQLFGDRLLAVTIAGIEGAIVTIRTSATRYPPIPVRTGESRIYRNLLHPKVRELLPDPRPKVIIIRTHNLKNNS